MALKETYANIEDKWYSFLDSLEDKGIPVYKVVDPIENAGIPSFPLFIGVSILIILGIIYAGMGSGSGLSSISGITVHVSATDIASGHSLQGAAIEVIGSDGNMIATGSTGPDGQATLRIPGRYKGDNLVLQLTKPNCVKVQKLLVPNSADITMALSTQCSSSTMPKSCLGITGNTTTIQLTDASGAIPTGCTVQVVNPNDPSDIIPVDWTVDGNGYLHIDIPSSGCPNEGNYSVQIDCVNMKWSGSWSDFTRAVKLGSIIMTDKLGATTTPTLNSTNNNLITIPVTVEAEDGTPLTGIEVTATDKDGVPLSGSGKIKTSGTTDAIGQVNLVLPSGQEFYLTTKDPNGAYFSKNVTGNGNLPYTANTWLAMSGITIKMDRGYPTVVYVKEQDTQKPVSGALVSVTYNGKLVVPETMTDMFGKVSFVLLKGKVYTLHVRSANYGVANGTVVGGGNTTIWMVPLDLAKVGNLEVHVISAHGMENPMSGARVKLVKGNQTYNILTTNAAGLVKFTNIEEGTYTIEVEPPGAVYYQSFPSVSVNAGNTTSITLKVIPKQVHITVEPMICIHPDKCVPKENVHVEIWNSWLEEKINQTNTGVTRKAVFTLDYGTKYFIVASWVDPTTGEKYGPVTYNPGSPAYSDTTIQFNVKQISNANVSFTIKGLNGGTLVRGHTYTGVLSVTLPEFAPGTKFKEVDVELFTGEPGTVVNVQRTPIAIGEVSLTDLSTQDPIITKVVKSAEYYYGKQPTPGATGLAKYIKIVIGKYKNAREYTAEIPIYVRAGARGTAKINYRATWITPDGRIIQSNQGLWKTVTYSITGPTETGSIPLTEGPFYQYKAWLSLTKNGSPMTTATITNGSYIYVNFNATARNDINNWVITLNSIPEKFRPISFEGWILRHATGNKTYITQTRMNGWTLQNTQGLYALNKDDILHGVITLEALAPGDASIVLFRDVDHPLNVKVSDIPALEKDTTIAGVTGKLNVYWYSLSNNNMKGVVDITKDVLPADNKEFMLYLTLKNKNQNVPVTANILVRALDSSIKFTEIAIGQNVYNGTMTYIQNATVTIPAGGERRVEVVGIGQASKINEMGVFVYEAGTPVPKQPWAIIRYGPVDYGMTYRCLLDGKQLPYPTVSCNEVDVAVIRTVEGQKTSVTNRVNMTVNGKTATLEKAYFAAKFPNGIGRHLYILATSDYFGQMSESPKVAYLDIIPKYPNSLDFTRRTLPKLNENRTKYITITNNYPVPVTFTVSGVTAMGWNIDVQPNVFYQNGTNLTKVAAGSLNSPIKVMPGQKLIIKITADPTNIVCREKQNPIISITSPQLQEPLNYGLILQCNSSGAVVNNNKGIVLKPVHVVREATDPGAITRFSCSYAKTANTSYLCDAEQLAVAIAKAADNLLNDPATYSATYTYAFGNDLLTQAAFEKAIKSSGATFSKVSNVFETKKAAEESSGHDIVFNGYVTCGYVTVNLTKFNMDQDVMVKVISDNGNASWCNKSSPEYLIGLMNYDRDIRPLFGKYYSFTSDQSNADIFKAIDEAVESGNNVSAGALFGYGVNGVDPNTIVSTITGGNAQSFIKWKVCPIGNSLDCPGYAVNYLKNNDSLGIVGYMIINRYNDIYMGMVYDPDKVPSSMLPRYEIATITRLMSWAMLGTVPEKKSLLSDLGTYWVYAPLNDNLTKVIDVKGPKVTAVTIYWTDGLGNNRTDFAGSPNVTVMITASKNANACYAANLLPNGTFVGPGGKGKPVTVSSVKLTGSNTETFEYDHWELIPSFGIKHVAAYCVDKAGVTSNIKVGSIKLDTSGLELLGSLPQVVLMLKPYENNSISFKVMSRYTNVTECWLEWPKDTMFNGRPPQPTEGKLDSEGHNACNNSKDENRNGYLSDGCCHREGGGSGVYGLYNYSNITCNSIVVPQGQYNKYLPVLVKCKNAAGTVRTLGEVNFYEYAPNAPKILLPSKSFAMGWFNWTSTQSAVVLDQPFISGGKWYENITAQSPTPSSNNPNDELKKLSKEIEEMQNNGV